MLKEEENFICVEGKYFPLKFAEKGEIEGSSKSGWDALLEVIKEVAPAELNVYREKSYFSSVKKLSADLKDCTNPGNTTAVPVDSKDLHFKYLVVCGEKRCKIQHTEGGKCLESCVKCPMRGCVGGKFSVYYDEDGTPHTLTTYCTIALFLTTNECRHKKESMRVPNFTRIEKDQKTLVSKLRHMSAKLVR